MADACNHCGVELRLGDVVRCKTCRQNAAEGRFIEETVEEEAPSEPPAESAPKEKQREPSASRPVSSLGSRSAPRR
jgi:hypothetical protein